MKEKNKKLKELEKRVIVLEKRLRWFVFYEGMKKVTKIPDVDKNDLQKIK